MARVLIILPPSESKRPPMDTGPAVAIDALSFPELTPTRESIAEALVETSAGLDAFSRLGVRPTLAGEVARNTLLMELPAMPVLDVYTGPLHLGLDAGSLDADASARASTEVVVVSALWGALRPADEIPPYRLHACAHLVGMDRLEPTWREVLPDVLGAAAGQAGVIVDLRSPAYQALGLPAGRGDRIVTLRVARQRAGGGFVGDVVAKRVRGQAARHLLESDVVPSDPDEVAMVLGDRWPVGLERTGPGRSWTLTLHSTD